MALSDLDFSVKLSALPDTVQGGFYRLIGIDRNPSTGELIDSKYDANSVANTIFGALNLLTVSQLTVSDTGTTFDSSFFNTISPNTLQFGTNGTANDNRNYILGLDYTYGSSPTPGFGRLTALTFTFNAGEILVARL